MFYMIVVFKIYGKKCEPCFCVKTSEKVFLVLFTQMAVTEVNQAYPDENIPMQIVQKNINGME